MSTFTEHYDLTLPEDSDYYDVAVFNSNFDTLDGALAETTAEVEGVNDKIGAPMDSNSETVFGKLNQLAAGGGSVIKSIQHVIHPITKDTTSSSVAIAPVNVSKTVVISEILRNNYGSQCECIYTLQSNQITCTHPDMYGNMTFGFWIVEFV